MKLLIVEDNMELAENIAAYLKLESNEIKCVYDGKSALTEIANNSYDCILLDLQLPFVAGEEVSRIVRDKNIDTPIIVLTAKKSKNSIIRNLEIGADDYVTKPFDLKELSARIKALTRRHKGNYSNQIKINNIEVDTEKHKVFKDSKEVLLSPKEYYLLEYLIQNRGKVQNRLSILENVWGEADELLFSQTVDVHIAYLRKKLGKEIIETAIGGYLIN